jgi:hypothetical protein
LPPLAELEVCDDGGTLQGVPGFMAMISGTLPLTLSPFIGVSFQPGA